MPSDAEKVLQRRRFSETEGPRWDEFISRSVNGTLFHQHRFLGYHGPMFLKEMVFLGWEKNGELLAVLPLGFQDADGKRIARSSIGASWGGLVLSPGLSARHQEEIVGDLLLFCRESGVSECTVAVAPHCYSLENNFSFEFSLISQGFQLARREITHVLTLPTTFEDYWSGLCRKDGGSQARKVRKAEKSFASPQRVGSQEFYPILQENMERLGVGATHSLEELRYLENELPHSVWFNTVESSAGKKAGIGYFRGSATTLLTFYLAQQNEAVGLNGLNLLIVEGVKHAIEGGYRFLDLGTTSIGGKIQNLGLVQFKESFGALGQCRDSYRIAL